MSERKVTVIGAGNRFRSTTLPVLMQLRERVVIAGVYDAKPRAIEAHGTTIEPRRIEDLTADAAEGSDLINVAVTKQAVPSVLRRLAAFDLSATDLLIETPVLLFKHLRHDGLLRSFRNAFAAEDCLHLPCFDPVREVLNRGDVGELRELIFRQSAWRYHALATVKALGRCDRIRSARRRKAEGSRAWLEVRLANGVLGRILEPKDYENGTFELVGRSASISDDPSRTGAEFALEPVTAVGHWVGFRVGDVECRLNPDELAVLGQVPAGTRLFAATDAMKRVGLLRLITGILDGHGGYSVIDALEDMAVDYLVEKARFYRSSPFTGVRSTIGRMLYRTVSRAAGG